MLDDENTFDIFLEHNIQLITFLFFKYRSTKILAALSYFGDIHCSKHLLTYETNQNHFCYGLTTTLNRTKEDSKYFL